MRRARVAVLVGEMDFELGGKTALITGGSRGIGKAVAHQLAAEGVDLALVARGRAALESSADEVAKASGRRVFAIVADTGNDDSVAEMNRFAQSLLGNVDILVNCAARPGYLSGVSRLAAVGEDLVRDEMNVKVMGYLRCAQAVAPRMIERGWGRIISISGLNARFAGNVVASMRNVAVAALTRNLADELGPYGINVTVVHPWATRTDEWPEVVRERAVRAGATPEVVERRLSEPTIIQRLVEAREVAYVVAFLASPRSVAINGDAIVVGGGIRGAIHY